jgi:hypothetical protein
MPGCGSPTERSAIPQHCRVSFEKLKFSMNRLSYTCTRYCLSACANSINTYAVTVLQHWTLCILLWPCHAQGVSQWRDFRNDLQLINQKRVVYRQASNSCNAQAQQSTAAHLSPAAS